MNEKNTVAPATCGCRKAKNDIILILALLAIVAAVGAFVLLFRSEGEAVVVSVDGVQYGEYSLFEDRSVEIRIGDNLNYLIIKEGKAYMEQASCPDGPASRRKLAGLVLFLSTSWETSPMKTRRGLN